MLVALTLACVAVDVYAAVVLIRLLLSWFASPATGVLATVNRGLWAATEPVLTPIRTAVRPVQVGSTPVDLAPVVLLVLLAAAGALLCR